MNTSIFKKTAAGFALAALLGASAAVPASAAELLNSSYDVARELFTALNKPFIEEWDKAHPDGSRMPVRPNRLWPSFRDRRPMSSPLTR